MRSVTAYRSARSIVDFGCFCQVFCLAIGIALYFLARPAPEDIERIYLEVAVVVGVALGVICSVVLEREIAHAFFDIADTSLARQEESAEKQL